MSLYCDINRMAWCINKTLTPQWGNAVTLSLHEQVVGLYPYRPTIREPITLLTTGQLAGVDRNLNYFKLIQVLGVLWYNIS
jgi:hypothetical protein